MHKVSQLPKFPNFERSIAINMITDLFLSVLEISLSTSLIALVLILLAPFLNRRYAAKWNYLIWIFFALRLLIPLQGPSLADILAQFTAPAAAQNETIPAATLPNETVSEQRILIEIPPQLMTPIVVPSEKGSAGITLLNAIAAVWLAGVLAFISLHFFSYLHYKRQLLKRGTAIKDAPSSQLLLCLSEELNIKQTVTLIEYSEADSPMMMGFLKPILVLPKECYNAEELYFILKHELVHLKRHDIYAKLLFMLANAVHWFNPLIWLMQKEAVIDMELSCDERVVQGAEYTVRRAYTETLFSTLRRKRAKKTMLSTQFYGGKQVMKKRFMNILEKAKKKNGAVLLMGAVVLTILCGVLIGCSVGNSVSFGQENSQEEIQKIYSDVFKNYQKAKPLIYGALIETGEEVSDENGQPYLLVMDFAYRNAASIQEVLDSTFSSAYIKTYLSWVLQGEYPLYKEIDGRLCVALADAVGEGLTEDVIEVLEQTGNTIKVKIAGDPDDAVIGDYEVTLVKENSRWVIDQMLKLTAENAGPNERNGLADAEFLAYVTSFDAQGLSFDAVEWVLIPSDCATELGFSEDDGPNGFVIYNEEEKALTLPFAKDCSCTILDWQDSFAPAEITLEQFLAVLEERSNNTVPYWLTIKNNEIVKVQEQYIP